MNRNSTGMNYNPQESAGMNRNSSGMTIFLTCGHMTGNSIYLINILYYYYYIILYSYYYIINYIILFYPGLETRLRTRLESLSRVQ